MFCEKCGGELPEGAAFCPKCGNEVDKKTTEEKQETPNRLRIERINFDIPHVSTMKDPKKSKRPVFVVIGLLVVLVIVVETLLVPVFRQRDAKKVVEEAFQKTVQTLKEEAKESEGVDSEYGYIFEITSDYYRNSDHYNGSTDWIEELGNVRILLTGNISERENHTYGSLEIGFGDMKNIRMEYASQEDGFYLFLPDLYSRTFFVPVEAFEDMTRTNFDRMYDREAGKEALASLENTLESIYDDLYTNAKCTKLEKVTLKENGSLEAERYEVTVSAAVYQSFLESFPKKLKEDRIFWDWLEEITSKEMVEELLDSICENMEQYEIPKDAEEIILSYVSIDKEGRVVQLEVPFENDSEGEFVTSFLGRERLSDFISFNIHADDGYSKQQMEFLYQTKGQPQSAEFSRENCLTISEENQLELGMAIVEILKNVSNKGYLPSEYKDDLDELLMYYDAIDSDTYYSMEDDNYNIWSYEMKYSEDGNPILIDYDGIYQIELAAPDGTEVDLEWSYSTYISFIDDEGDISYDYEIVHLEDDTQDRFPYERSYLTDDYYTNVVFSEIMQKEINSYQVYYQYCSYDYSFDTGCKIYYAWVRLDKENVLELYVTDFTNSVEDTVLDECFQFVLPIQ